MGTIGYYDPERRLNVNSYPLPGYAHAWLKYLLAVRNMAPRTIYDYATSAQSFLRWIKSRQTHTAVEHFTTMDIRDVPEETLAGLTRTDIINYMAFCRTELGNAAASCATKLAAVRSLYNYLIHIAETSVIDTNPASDVPTPKAEQRLPVYMTQQECKEMLQTISGEAKERDLCILLWLLNCGMRLSELVAVNCDDVRNGTLLIHGKGRKERSVPLNAVCMAALENYLVFRQGYPNSDTEQALFISKRTGARLTGRRVAQIMEKAIKSSQLTGRGYSPHKLRHTCATLLYQNGLAGILEIKELLGHTSVATTQIYCHTAANALRNAMDGMDELLTEDDPMFADMFVGEDGVEDG